MVCRVVVVDDADSVRDLLSIRFELEDELQVVGTGDDGLEAIDLAGQLRPDVVVLDNQMPHLDGLSAIPLIRCVAPATRIVVFSACDTIQDAALEAGACAYVDKAQSLETLVTVVLDVGSQYADLA